MKTENNSPNSVKKQAAPKSDSGLKKNEILQFIKYYLAWILLIWLAIAVYYFSPYYKSFLLPRTKSTLFDLAFAYTLVAPAFYYISYIRHQKISPSRAHLAITTLTRLGKGYSNYLQKMITKAFYPAPVISREERTNLLFMLVKLFFLPLMLNFLFANIASLRQAVDSIDSQGLQISLQSFNMLIYPFLFSALLLIDTAYFTFGYAVESKFLNNKVVSVDPTFLGWASALICYPPLNNVAVNYLNWHANDYAIFGHIGLTSLLYLLVFMLMFIYTSASVALGAKASNLTNRGIVCRWPYNFIRHPAYISKNLAWWLTLIPVFSFAAFLSMAAWSFIYFLRAITEERHLMMVENGYREYARQVRWRFIPKVI